MNEWPLLVLAAAAGAAAGVVFFGGLQWTVGRALDSARPARWLLASFVARLAVLGALLVAAGQGHVERVAAMLAGVLLARSWWLARSGARALGARS